MQPIVLETESYLFEVPSGNFRATPFFELSLDEWVIYENDIAVYYLDFNRKAAPLIVHLTKQLNEGMGLDAAIKNLGESIHRNWTIHHNIKGEVIEDSWKKERIELNLLSDVNEITSHRP